MKKLLLVTMIILCMGMIACSKNNEKKDNKPTIITESTKPSIEPTATSIPTPTLEPTATPEPTPTPEPEPEIIYKLPSWLKWGMTEGEFRSQYKKKDPIATNADPYIVLTYFNIGNYTDLKYYGVQSIFNSENNLIAFSYNVRGGGTGISIKTDYSKFLDEYEMIKEKLNILYENDIIEYDESEEWIDDRYKNDEYMLGYAIEKEQYIKICKFIVDNNIKIILTLKNGITIFYEYTG